MLSEPKGAKGNKYIQLIFFVLKFLSTIEYIYKAAKEHLQLTDRSLSVRKN